MTPSELKQLYESNNPDGYFFDRKSMKFFGDTMSNYGVSRAIVIFEIWATHYDDGKPLGCWELRRKHPVKLGLCTSHYFDDEGSELMGVSHKQ